MIEENKLEQIHKQWKYNKYYENHIDEFAEEYFGCRLLPYQKSVLKMMNLKDTAKTWLYPNRDNSTYCMLLYRITEFILSDNKSLVFLCGSNIDKHYDTIVKFTNGQNIEVQMRKNKNMITLEKCE